MDLYNKFSSVKINSNLDEDKLQLLSFLDV